MGSAAEYLKSMPDVTPVISVGEETSRKIIHFFNEIKDGLENKTFSTTELIEKIVEVELSEWNDIVLDSWPNDDGGIFCHLNSGNYLAPRHPGM